MIWNRPWAGYVLSLTGMVITYGIGALTSYEGTRDEAYALSARVTINTADIRDIRQAVIQWRAEDQAGFRDIQEQVRQAVGLLNTLNGQLGPAPRR